MKVLLPGIEYSLFLRFEHPLDQFFPLVGDTAQTNSLDQGYVVGESFTDLAGLEAERIGLVGHFTILAHATYLCQYAMMKNPQGNGLREWQASLSPEQRVRYAKKGGKARARKLSKQRRQEIASMGGRRRSLIITAKKQPLTDL